MKLKTQILNKIIFFLIEVAGKKKLILELSSWSRVEKLLSRRFWGGKRARIIQSNNRKNQLWV